MFTNKTLVFWFGAATGLLTRSNQEQSSIACAPFTRSSQTSCWNNMVIIDARYNASPLLPTVAPRRRETAEPLPPHARVFSRFFKGRNRLAQNSQENSKLKEVAAVYFVNKTSQLLMPQL